MPIKKSASKELRKAKRRHLRNIEIASELKSLTKKFLNLIEQNKTEPAKEVLRTLAKRLDKAVHKNILPKNKAARKKSRLTRKLR